MRIAVFARAVVPRPRAARCRHDIAQKVTRAAEGSNEIVRRSVRADRRGISYLTVEGRRADETLLLIHGSGMSARSWTEQLRGLGKAVQVLAVDLPGHGEFDPLTRSLVVGF